jgi:hypothetical protein
VLAFIAAFAATLGFSCSHGRCYTNDDCHHGMVCMQTDEVGKVIVKPESCPKGSVLCGLKCLEPCGEGTCLEGQVCGSGGCCEAAKECRLNSECPGDQLCRAGKCLDSGRCEDAEPKSKADKT